ncbi:MAG: ATP--corrinoid adenosyltransferase [Cyanobium sp.]|uniref:cob(I)yrinic acid a,c-diamide adenosyltransferase n=1 Tax=Synechococcus sp. CS-1333 TaxID=2848638 RepID=UPI000DBC3F93|nr:cob(I)yrinic acid a,c-diamide adenosyltransferase [Synechococcus sp. CS-1333]MCT0211699.1 cob(I)yrinic acid a,c-diamide adenosyltransferase [Synechococcus sp. CS-1333]PZV20768.1 MAG: ATP--corrinoid adenosyltransferase [Cyanobium sp.]
MTASLLNPSMSSGGVPSGAGPAGGPRSHAPGRPHGAAAAAPVAAVAPRPLALVPPAQTEGLLQVHTAPFRGSFSGVFSQALRSAGLGSRVLISQFLKGGVDQGLERSLWLCGRLQWLRPAMPACLTEPAEADAEPEGPGAEQQQAVLEVWGYTRRQLLDGAVDLMVLDELGLAIALGYLPAAEVEATLEQRPAHLDVILTGPSMPPALLAMADQVTQLRRNC